MGSKPSAVSNVLQKFSDSNPFYLISACCMLAGCLALTNSLSWLSIPPGKLLILIATLNFYEAALIGLAAYLILVRGLRRDGMVLLILEAFFLIDVTFLDAEIATQKSWLGPTVAALSFGLTIIKLAAIFRILGLGRSPAKFAFILLQMAAILALPLLMSRSKTGNISPLEFYLAWWVVGLMPAVYELLERFLGSADPSDSRSAAVSFYLLLPWLSVAAHLSILHYVYGVPYYAAMAAPPLLAVAMALNRLNPIRALSQRDIVILQILLPLVAILVSTTNAGPLTILVDRAGHFTLTTSRLAVIAAYLEIVYCFLRPYWLVSLLAGMGAFFADAYGPNLQQVKTYSGNSWSWLTQSLWSLVPKTITQWGAMAVVAAFAFLGIGATISLRRSSPGSPTHDAPEI